LPSLGPATGATGTSAIRAISAPASLFRFTRRADWPIALVRISSRWALSVGRPSSATTCKLRLSPLVDSCRPSAFSPLCCPSSDLSPPFPPHIEPPSATHQRGIPFYRAVGARRRLPGWVGHRIRDLGGERAPEPPHCSPMGVEARSQTSERTLDKARSRPQIESSKFGRTTFAAARFQSPTLTQSPQKSKIDDDFASRSRVVMLASEKGIVVAIGTVKWYNSEKGYGFIQRQGCFRSRQRA
jgi:'Cold-shock' DNA-binding domain